MNLQWPSPTPQANYCVKPHPPAHFLPPLDVYATPTPHDEDRGALGRLHPSVMGGIASSCRVVHEYADVRVTHLSVIP